MITLSTMLITGIAAGTLTGCLAYYALDSSAITAATWATCFGFPLGILPGGFVGLALNDRCGR